MFEDALMESGGHIRTRAGWFSGMAALVNGSIVCLLVLWPLLHPASLPRQTLSTLLMAPAPPAPPAPATPHLASAPARLYHSLASAKARPASSNLLTDSFDTDSQ